MPCTYEPSQQEIEESFQRNALALYKPKLDKLTRLLCEACNLIECEYGNLNCGSKELSKWWIKHKKEDTKRLKKEAKIKK